MSNLQNSLPPLCACPHCQYHAPSLSQRWEQECVGDGALTSEIVDACRAAVADRNFGLEQMIHKHGPAAGVLNQKVAGPLLARQFTHSPSKDPTPVTNQKSSGRCWMFAGLNLLRLEAMKNLKLDSFEFSETYLYFYDKLEKANQFLELAISTRNEPLNGDVRNMAQTAILSPCGDGGLWNYFTNLVKKYGLIPKEAMNETASSENSRDLNRRLTTFLRSAAMEIRAAAQERSEPELHQMKEVYLEKVYHDLVLLLGEPPTSFDWDFSNKEKKRCSLKDMTPQTFYDEYVNIDLDQYVILGNFPRIDDSGMYQKIVVEEQSNVHSMPDWEILNVPINELEFSAIKAIEAGRTLYFAAQMNAHTDSSSGLMSCKGLDGQHVFQMAGHPDKATAIASFDSWSNHAMHLVGMDKDSNSDEVRKWDVENSWGSDRGAKGRFTMDRDFFQNHVFKLVAHKSDLSEAAKEALKKAPEVMKPWHRLAKCMIEEVKNQSCCHGDC